MDRRPAPARNDAFADVLITDELARRPPRQPDLDAERRALSTLAEQIGRAPGSTFEVLVSISCELCRADSAGLSLVAELPTGAPVLRRRAAAGALGSQLAETSPRIASPCGLALDLGAPQLFDRPGRYFPHLALTSPAILEGLVVPFAGTAGASGTLWIASHDPARRFDREDARTLTTLCSFVTAALQLASLLEGGRAADGAGPPVPRGVFAHRDGGDEPGLPAEPDWGPLPPRQRDVAALVALGLTNSEIARVLVIQHGTAANYVQRLRERLGFSSRSQVAAWVAEDPGRRTHRPRATG